MKSIWREKRACQRYPVRWRFEGRGLSFLGFPTHEEELVCGRLLNINRGGLCLLVERPIERSSVLQCAIYPSALQVGIPTIVEVRWMHPNADHSHMRVGLKFLTEQFDIKID